MLAQYLIDHNFGPVTYVNGTYYGNEWDNCYSHTWLVVNEKIIDITGDQFRYYDEPLRNIVPVYVGPTNKFYELFEIAPSGKHKHYGLNDRWINYQELCEWYKAILMYL